MGTRILTNFHGENGIWVTGIENHKTWYWYFEKKKIDKMVNGTLM